MERGQIGTTLVSHLTPGEGGPYTRDERKLGPVENDGNPNLLGHYGFVGYIDLEAPLNTQLDAILAKMGTHIVGAEGEYCEGKVRRAQLKLMVNKSQLADLIKVMGGDIEGIVEMTGEEWVYVLCGQTAATSGQWDMYRQTAKGTHRAMVDVATKGVLSRPIPPLGNQDGYIPSHGTDSVIPEPEAELVMGKIKQLAIVQKKTGTKPWPCIIRRVANDKPSAAEHSDSPERNNEFNIGYLLPEQRKKYGIAPVYIDQQSLSEAGAPTRAKWVESIVRIWGPKFGWDEQKVNDLFDDIAIGKNKSWICAVEQKGTLVAAAIADVATITDQKGKTKGVIIESNEWGVDEETSTRLNNGTKLPGIGSLAVTLVHATAALRCLNESGEVVGLEVDGKRYPTAVYAEVNAATDIPACKAALRTQMSATTRPNGEIGCMYGHVMVNGKPHGVFMIMQLHPEDMKALVNGKGREDFVRLIGYSERLANYKNKYGNVFCWKTAWQRTRTGRHKVC